MKLDRSFRSISPRPLIPRTVTDIFNESPVLRQYAKSVDFLPLDNHEKASTEASTLTNMEVKGNEQGSSLSESLGEEHYQDCESPPSKTNRDATLPEDETLSAKQTSQEKTPERHVPADSLVHKALENGVWGLTQSELIREDHDTEWTGVPGCTSADQAMRDWRLTATILSTYTAMRGPYRNVGRDMFVWMDRCGKTFETEEGNDHNL